MEMNPLFAEKIPAIVFFAEVLLFALVEKKLWRTLFTPFNCLALPYAFVVGLCLCVSGRMGYAYFDYSSLWVYAAGLLLFFLPSFFFGLLSAATEKAAPRSPVWRVPASDILSFWERVTQVVLVLFLFWLAYLLLSSPFPVGSDDFGTELAGKGLFGHLFTLLMILSIPWMALFDFKENRRYGIYAAGFLMIAVLYQVKGWLLIPVFSAVILRFFSGKMRIRLRVFVLVLVAGFFFFALTYWLNMFVAGSQEGMARYGLSRGEYALSTIEYIQKHFVTYLTAGVYGFSQDMARGIVEGTDPSMIFAPFINIAHVFTGDPMVVPLNKHYLPITELDNPVNVRSLMGTLYVFLGGWGAAAFMLVSSFLANMLFLIARQRGDFFLWVFMGWLLGLLAMGWFDTYVQTLNFVTFPLFLLFLAAVWQYGKLRRESRLGA